MKQAKAGKKLFGVRVPVELLQRARIEAVRRGITMAALVEAALRQYLGARRGRAP